VRCASLRGKRCPRNETQCETSSRAVEVDDRDFWSGRLTPTLASVFAGYLSKSPKDVPVAELSDLEIAGPAERDGAGMTKGFPERLRTLDRIGRTWASDRFTGDDVVTDVVEGHDHELDDLGHKPASSVTPRSLAAPRRPRFFSGYRTRGR
jgi:hypothetical protein